MEKLTCHLGSLKKLLKEIEMLWVMLVLKASTKNKVNEVSGSAELILVCEVIVQYIKLKRSCWNKMKIAGKMTSNLRSFIIVRHLKFIAIEHVHCML